MPHCTAKTNGPVEVHNAGFPDEHENHVDIDRWDPVDLFQVQPTQNDYITQSLRLGTLGVAERTKKTRIL